MPGHCGVRRRSPFHLRSFGVACLLVSIAFAGQLSSQRRSEWQWDDVDRVVALGDVHGRYDQLTALVRGTGLVDDAMNWVGGRAHLVLCGDLVDRGPDDRRVLDLVRGLQPQAISAGGAVHALLGNHEVLNLVRDFRYVIPAAFAAFASDERSSDRQAARTGYGQALTTAGSNSQQVDAAFDKHFPPGYFGRQSMFDERGDYGRWLLEQPAVIKVNGIIFLHGGLTPQVAALGLDQINRRVSDGIKKMMHAERDLSDAVPGPAGLAELLDAARQIGQGRGGVGAMDVRLTGAARELIEAMNSLAMAPDGPLWYRGTSLENERIERTRVSKVLQALDGRGITMGHTVTKTGRISTRFNARVYRADVGMVFGHSGTALVIDQQGTRTFDPMTKSYSAPQAEPPFGEGWAAGYEDLADDVLERFLGVAEVGDRLKIERDGQTAEVWEMRHENVKLRAVFKDETGRPPTSSTTEPVGRYQHEIAAYRLDRQLGLGFVPVAVERKIGKRKGMLRAVVETAVDVVSLRSYLNLGDAEQAAVIRGVAKAYGVDESGLTEQVVRARVFDGLIGNLNRQRDDALFVPGEGRMALVNHLRVFSTNPEISAIVLEHCRPLPADLAATLAALSRSALTASLGSYLSPAQIDALLVRRDRLIAACRSPG